MNIVKFTLLSLLLLLNGPVLQADPTAVLPVNPSDPVREALAVLQGSYVDFTGLHYQKGDQLADLIARSDGKIRLDPPEILQRIPIITAALPDGIIYWRMVTFTPKKDWGDLADKLRWMIDDQHAVGAILDLRSNTAPDDYAGAAQVLTFFVSGGRGDCTLNQYFPQQGDGVFHMPFFSGRQVQGPLIVLTNNQTTGAAEALAACLKADGALVIGGATAGKTTFFEEHELSSGQILRFVPIQTTLADGTPLLGRAVEPDIALAVDDHTEKAALMLIRDNHILDVIQESAERHRMSEAALVQGEDPERDDYLASLEKKPVLLSLPIIHDAALIRALDSLKAIRLSRGPVAPQATANASPSATSSLQ